MPKPRCSQVSLASIPYYHCVSRCVRRAFLCAKDTATARSFEHRHQWIEDKLYVLSDIFSIELYAYAVMSNHYHLVLFVDQPRAAEWSVDEVIRRWHLLFSGNFLSQRYLRGESMSRAERDVLDDCVTSWRGRLIDISWFMRVLNEGIARKANAEDQCTGRFWEGRFKSQALLDEAALMACLAYVDLNPVRAGMAKTPEASKHTRIKKHITQAQTAHIANHPQQQAKGLFPFVGNPRGEMPPGLAFKLTDYLELVDWSGRILRAGKRGSIDSQCAPILERLNIEPEHWGYLIKNFESRFKSLVGSAFKLKQACQALDYQRTLGIRSCEYYFS